MTDDLRVSVRSERQDLSLLGLKQPHGHHLPVIDLSLEVCGRRQGEMGPGWGAICKMKFNDTRCSVNQMSQMYNEHGQIKKEHSSLQTSNVLPSESFGVCALIL